MSDINYDAERMKDAAFHLEEAARNLERAQNFLDRAAKNGIGVKPPKDLKAGSPNELASLLQDVIEELVGERGYATQAARWAEWIDAGGEM